MNGKNAERKNGLNGEQARKMEEFIDDKPNLSWDVVKADARDPKFAASFLGWMGDRAYQTLRQHLQKDAIALGLLEAVVMLGMIYEEAKRGGDFDAMTISGTTTQAVADATQFIQQAGGKFQSGHSRW